MLNFIVLAIFLCSVRSVRKVQRVNESVDYASRPNITRGGSYGGNGGGKFDLWQWDKLAGAINKICVRSGWFVDQIEVYFAGHPVSKGGSGGGRDCFVLRPKEYITKVWMRVGDRVDAIQFKTSWNIWSQHFGGSGGYEVEEDAPPGMHLMSFYGSSGVEVDNLGLWWGRGGGSGYWRQIPSCRGCSNFEYEVQTCSKEESSSGREVTKEWSVAVQSEMSAEFEWGGAGVSVSSSYSQKAVQTSSYSFSNTRCETIRSSCYKRGLWQWTFSSNFDGKGYVSTGGNFECSDEEPCCLPGTFKSNPAICDDDWSAPNRCR